MPIQYREMTASDYAAACDLWEDTENMGLSLADQSENISAFLSRNPGLNFVAVDGEELVGTVLCGHDGRRGAIYHLAVTRHMRHQGIGRQLVQRCLNGLQAAGIERCHIHVYADNQDGIAFWRKGGWFTRPELSLLSIDIPV